MLVAVLLAVPLAVAAAWGQWWADDLARWRSSPPADAVLVAVVVGILAADLLLPVPSGPVMTLAGAHFGTLPAIGITWLGLMLGATVGFALARYGGRPLMRRFVAERDLADLDGAGRRYGPWVLLVSRPMPILAEASVVVAGLLQTPWWLFLCMVGVGNFLCSIIFCTLGDYAAANEWVTTALFLSVVVPVLLLVAARQKLASRRVRTNPVDLSSGAEAESPPR